MAHVAATRPARWPAVLAWGLLALVLLTLLAVPWSDQLLRRAGRPDLVQFTPEVFPAVFATVTGAAIGAIVATRRARHPAGWLLLGIALALCATAAMAQYLVYGTIRPGGLPGLRYAAVGYFATGTATLVLISYVLLLTPTGSLPSRRWRPLAWAGFVAPAGLVLVAALTTGPTETRRQVIGNPFDLSVFSGVALAANSLALGVTLVVLAAAGWSLIARFGRARGVERQQLRWVTWAAAMSGLLAVAGVIGFALGADGALGLAATAIIMVVPAAVGAATLRFRLYDLDRIISRTVAYGLLTVLLGGGYALVVLGLGQLAGSRDSVVVAAATLAVAAVFQPARRRVQRAVDRRFNRRSHDAARTIEGFSARLREHLALDTLTTEMLAVVDQTMQPASVSLWLSPSVTAGQPARRP